MKVRYFERGPVWWVDVRDGGGLRKKVSTGKKTLEEAEKVGPELALRALAELRAGKPSPSVIEKKPKWTLKAAFEETMRTRQQWMQSNDKGSLHNTFNVLVEQFGEDFPIEKFDYDFVLGLRSAWMNEPGKKKGTKTSPSTINGRLSMLSVLLDTCRIRPHGVKHLSVKGNRRTRRMNQHEIRQMQSWLLANSHRTGALCLHDMITVALDTGARAGELEKLGHGDIEFGPQIITLRDTKNGETRRVPFNDASKRIFENRRDLPGGPFAELNKSQRSALMRDMREGLGLENDEQFVFHILRHEAASRMIAAGVDALVVKSYMGHSSISTTQIYVHNNDETLIAAKKQREQYEALQNLPASGTVQ